MISIAVTLIHGHGLRPRATNSPVTDRAAQTLGQVGGDNLGGGGFMGGGRNLNGQASPFYGPGLRPRAATCDPGLGPRAATYEAGLWGGGT